MRVVRDQRPQAGTGVLRAHGVTDRGPVRPTNEDCFEIDDRLRLCVVADGMGGHNGGEVAARIAVSAVTKYVRGVILSKPQSERDPETSVRAVGDPQWPFGFDSSVSEAGNLLRTAVHLANIHILETAASTRELSGMGTTLVAALVRDRTLSVAHVGDSRVYLFAGRELRLLTRDDSWVASLIASDSGADRAWLQHHPMRNLLTNVMGTRTRTDVHITEKALTGGELLVLTTDGVHGAVDDAVLERVLAGGGNPAEIATRLIRTALGRGSRDNCTAVVARYVPS